MTQLDAAKLEVGTPNGRTLTPPPPSHSLTDAKLRRARERAAMLGDQIAGFYAMFTGQIESAEVCVKKGWGGGATGSERSEVKRSEAKRITLRAWRFTRNTCPPSPLPPQFNGLDNLFVQYRFVHGPDWRIMQGIDNGFSQVAQKGSAGDASIVWNFPVDVTFKSTNPFGWPRLVLSVYSKVRREPKRQGARAQRERSEPGSKATPAPSRFALALRARSHYPPSGLPRTIRNSWVRHCSPSHNPRRTRTHRPHLCPRFIDPPPGSPRLAHWQSARIL